MENLQFINLKDRIMDYLGKRNEVNIEKIANQFKSSC